MENDDEKARKIVKEYNLKLPSMLQPSIIQISSGLKFLILNRKYLNERVGLTDNQIDEMSRIVSDIATCMREDGLMFN